jgi:oligoendopeptidase F
MEYSLNWDLTCFFEKSNFELEMKQLASRIAALREPEDMEAMPKLLSTLQEIDLLLGECDAFIICLQSQNVADEQAQRWRAEFIALEATFQRFNNLFDAKLVQLDQAAFERLVKIPELSELSFILGERRQRAAKKLSLEYENLITDLSIDGYHSWGEFYPSLVSEVKIPFKQELLSFGQAENRMTDPDRNVREEIFFGLENVWKQKGPLFAQILNHIAGFRLQVYAQRGWDSPLQEPLFENRMSAETLQAMWQAVEKHKKPLVAFLQAKAKYLKLKQLAWYDIEAPLFEGESEMFSYDQGAQLIIDRFTAFHPKMGAFAKQAFLEKWIEAEDRPGKRPGGFCIQFPQSRQSRIFMTYSGTMVNLSTLAHELGHAYHTAMIEDLPRFAQHYRMNVAETASTFAEQIISDAFLQQAKTKEQKLNILADRIERSTIFLMNIHARFLFEKQFYELRKKQFLSAEELCQLMKQAQEQAFCHELSVLHPYFWAAKLHFYFTGVPFYNFPYTFGYLFSLGLYARSKKQGPSFAKSYDALLKDSGKMTVEDLAKKHLDVDLTKPHFWNEAAALAVSDVDLFLKLAADDCFDVSGLREHINTMD